MADTKKHTLTENRGDIVIYQAEDGDTKIDVRFVDETVWLTQAQLVELFRSSKANISEHIKHIFEEGELNEISVVRKFRTTAADGKNYNVTYYNLDMIISLGYRVKSSIAPLQGISDHYPKYLLTLDNDPVVLHNSIR